MRNEYWLVRVIGVGLMAAGLLAAAGASAPGEALAQARRSGGRSAAPADTQEASAAAAPAGVVNINTATVEELTRLPGIGDSKARAIVASRERNRFARPEDLMRVRGIGRATFRRLRPMLRVDGRTTLETRPSPQPAAR